MGLWSWFLPHFRSNTLRALGFSTLQYLHCLNWSVDPIKMKKVGFWITSFGDLNCAGYFLSVHCLLCPEEYKTNSTRSTDCLAVSSVQEEGIFRGIFVCVWAHAQLIVASWHLAVPPVLPNQHMSSLKRILTHYCTGVHCEGSRLCANMASAKVCFLPSNS